MLLNVTGPHLKKSLSNSRGVPTILEMFLRIDISSDTIYVASKY